MSLHWHLNIKYKLRDYSLDMYFNKILLFLLADYVMDYLLIISLLIYSIQKAVAISNYDKTTIIIILFQLKHMSILAIFFFKLFHYFPILIELLRRKYCGSF